MTAITVGKMHKFTADKLRDLQEPISVGENLVDQPLVVIIPYATYLRYQQAMVTLSQISHQVGVPADPWENTGWPRKS